ncbi:hypothetical protein BCR32DRAFT_329881 [Anaeromyces robustus]|uniref:Inhibitor I9 domain-containing protein n=1 Tax=Anaeromyces robustus TaxID=1754192 RepID=A0A1Y1WNY2_9FUNG|nr:hypothetical protein BCR32DRAFT_329881 [Anaeromyces robustus]|eukprot:ORX75249.1 hypothetical protein BCR32DRAFT_329881 [Anaeromyces robustus]
MFGIPQEKTKGPSYSPTTLIIYVSGENGKEPLKRTIEEYKAEILYDYQNFNSIAVKIPSDKTIEESIEYFENVEGVIMVNRDQINQLC